MTISLQNTALSKGSFHENTAELLMHLSLIYDIYIIIHVNTEEDSYPIQRLLMDEGLFSSDAGLDSRKILFCQTEEGKIHIIRHIEPFNHIEGGLENDDGEEIVDKLKPFVTKITWITQRDVKKPHVDVAKSLLNTSVAREVMRK
ncbi:hypothetical protein K501DRAFT_218856 [Backusella circina FSU 941]|nr:hypothetical protein K501DRAFT_218856 [Backusella circina FSU 941]